MSENLNDALGLKEESKPESQPVAQRGTEAQAASGDGIKGYPVLETVSSLYKVLAWFVVLGAFIGIIVGINLLGKRTGLGPSGGTIILTSFIYGLFGFIGCLAISQAIQLFIDMASNSQRQVRILTKLLDKK